MWENAVNLFSIFKFLTHDNCHLAFQKFFHDMNANSSIASRYHGNLIWQLDEL